MSSQPQTIKLQPKFPAKLDFLFRPKRYKVAYGGRGGAKSWGYARALLIQSVQKPLRILCTREFQNSIADSVHKLLSEQIEALGLSSIFDVQKTTIKSLNGSEFIFAGLRQNITKLKSFEGIDRCWVEEAEKVSSDSWEKLIPTIRKPDSEIWVSFNPDAEEDPTYQRFIVNTPPNSMVVKIGWQDNPWFPEVLLQEKDYLASVDIDAYNHVWEGEVNRRSDAKILAGKYIVQSFVPGPEWDGPYFGADWGFANDPTTLIKMWIHDHTLYIDQEVWGVGIELDDTPAAFDHIPDSKKYVIRADCSRPETISHVARHGYPRIIGAKKWEGSVEDGIAFLRSFKRIVIHPRCPRTAEECKLYSYKVDKLTGDVLPLVVDKFNHCIDAIRYGLEPIIQAQFRKLNITQKAIANAMQRVA